MHESRELAVHAPLENAVVRLVGEEYVARAIASRPLGEGEIAGQLLQGRVGSDDLAIRRQHVDGANEGQEKLDTVFHISLDALIEIQMWLGVKRERRCHRLR